MAKGYGALLEEARQRKGLTLGQLARQVGINSVGHLCDVINGARPPFDGARTMRLAEILDIPPDELLRAAMQKKASVTLKTKGTLAQSVGAGLARMWETADEDELRELKETLDRIERSRSGGR